MRVLRHKSGNLIYESHGINFLQDFEGIFGSGFIPHTVANTPYLVLEKLDVMIQYLYLMFGFLLYVQ